MWVDLVQSRWALGRADAEVGQRMASSSGGTPSVPCGSSNWTVSGPLAATLRTLGWALAKLAGGLVGFGQGVEVAHQGGHVVAAGESSICGQLSRPSMLAMRPRKGTNMGADVGRQHGAHRHIGHVAVFAFMEADQHHAFDDMATDRRAR